MPFYPFEDIKTIFQRDPAARSGWEVVLCSPGLHAIWWHRLNHALWRRGFKLLARLGSHKARFFTGIEIHPGAQIGRRFFIDHGMGVVIGETTVIGNDVSLYQGVTLGGGNPWDYVDLEGHAHQGSKRHPTLLDGVIVGVGAKILGDVTVGEDSLVGAGSVVVRDVPPRATVVGVPARVVIQDGQRVEDPGKTAFLNTVQTLEQQLTHLRRTLGHEQAHSSSVHTPGEGI